MQLRRGSPSRLPHGKTAAFSKANPRLPAPARAHAAWWPRVSRGRPHLQMRRVWGRGGRMRRSNTTEVRTGARCGQGNANSRTALGPHGAFTLRHGNAAPPWMRLRLPPRRWFRFEIFWLPGLGVPPQRGQPKKVARTVTRPRQLRSQNTAGCRSAIINLQTI